MNRVARLCLLAVALAFAGVSGAYAQGYQGGSDAWRFGTTGGFTKNVQSGGSGFGGNFGFNKTFDFLGCSFSLNQFIQANFNLPSSFEEIKTALQTKLVKYAITNFSILPQLQSAIQDFQAKLGIDLNFAKESCNLSTIGQEQQKVKMQECADKYGSNSSSSDYISCIQGKGSPGTSAARNAQNSINQMANSLCRSVTETARGLFCGGQGECGIMSLLPQMKLTCNGKGSIIGGETKGAMIGVGTVGQSFQRFNAMINEKNASPVNQLISQGLTEDQMDNVRRRAEAVAAEGAETSQSAALSNSQGTQMASAREFHFLNFEGTVFAQESGGESGGGTTGGGETSGGGTSSGGGSSNENAVSENPLTEANVKRAMGCTNDDPMAVGKAIAKAANEFGYSVQEPNISDGERKAMSQAVLASLGSAGDIGKLNKADGRGIMKAVETIAICDSNQRGVDISAQFILARRSASERNAYFLGKSMQSACGQGEFLFKIATQGADGAIAKAKSSEVIQPSFEAATGDGSKATNAGKDKVISFAEYSRKQLTEGERMLLKICQQNRNAATVTKALGSDGGDYPGF